MTDEPRTSGGWLPPRAPGGEAPPRFEAPAAASRPDESLWAGSEHEPAAPAQPAPAQPAPYQQQWLPPAQGGEGAQPPPVSPPSPQPYWSPPPGQQPVFVQPRQATNNGPAIASLVFGIAGLAILVFSIGLAFFLSLAASGAAWGFAVTARKRIADGRATGGAGQAKAGLVLGIVGIALGVIAMITWIVLIAKGFNLEEWQRELERDLERRRNGSDGQLSELRAGLAALLQRH